MDAEASIKHEAVHKYPVTSREPKLRSVKLTRLSKIDIRVNVKFPIMSTKGGMLSTTVVQPESTLANLSTSSARKETHQNPLLFVNRIRLRYADISLVIKSYHRIALL